MPLECKGVRPSPEDGFGPRKELLCTTNSAGAAAQRFLPH